MKGPDVTWYLAVATFMFATGALGVLLRRSPLIVLLSAEFVAAAQVLVYAGAVMVMFLFVIAYLGGRADAPWAGGPSLNRMAAVIAAVAILVEVLVAIGLSSSSESHAASIGGSFGSPAEIGRLFLTDHLLAFEITSVVLLIAAVGGVVLGAHARRLQAEADETPPPPVVHVEESPVEIPAGLPKSPLIEAACDV